MALSPPGSKLKGRLLPPGNPNLTLNIFNFIASNKLKSIIKALQEMEIFQYDLMLIRNLIRSLRNLTLHLLETNNHIFCVFTDSCCWTKQWEPKYCTEVQILRLLPTPGKVVTPRCKHLPNVLNLFLFTSLNHIPLVSTTLLAEITSVFHTTDSDTRASSGFIMRCTKHSPPVTFRELTKVDILSLSTSVKSRIPKDWVTFQVLLLGFRLWSLKVLTFCTGV